ncbi:hypothetical protein EsH8_VI_001008 [Colletotrichum jinshuiense]
MNISAGGVSTLQQSGLPSSAYFDLYSNPFGNFTDEKNLQHHQHQRTRFLFQQQQQRLQQPTGHGTGNAPPVFVAPEALTAVPVAPSSIADRQSSTSTQSSGAWQDSPDSKPADVSSSPTSSIISPPAPPIDPLIISSAQETEADHPAATNGSPKRRRGRPRLSEDKPRATRAAASTASKTQKKKTSRRASTASMSGADDFGDKRGGTDDKKHRIRARNREAAYKCRQKKQKGIEELQTQEAMVERMNKTLNSEAAMLRGEILMLKNMVLQHGGCGCSYIEEYISGAAQNLVQSSIAANASAPASDLDLNAQSVAMNAANANTYVDWKTFDMDGGQAMPALGSESNFSGFDNVSSTGMGAQSHGATMA